MTSGDGKVMFSVDAEPGTYDAQVTGVDGATGWMAVFAQGADELAAQDASLAEALEGGRRRRAGLGAS